MIEGYSLVCADFIMVCEEEAKREGVSERWQCVWPPW